MRKRSVFLIMLATIGLISVVMLAHQESAVRSDADSIIMILTDTLRADHLGIYGYGRNTSPNIDALAHRGYLFTHAYAVSPWTNPSIASIFTGMFPQAIFPPAVHDDAVKQVLPLQLHTLAERLKGAGFSTVALVDHPGISPLLHYDQGFDVFIRLFRQGQTQRWAVTDPNTILKEFKQQVSRFNHRKLFLYLHLVYPHRPYAPLAPYDKMLGPGFQQMTEWEKQGMINRYDGEIRQTDALIGKVLYALKERADNRKTWVIFVADHGEAFWEHGLAEHGNSFFDELLRIPLIIAPPESVGRKIDDPVSSADLYPTILQISGLQIKPSKNLISLLSLMNGETANHDRLLFSESLHSLDIRGSACISRQWKCIVLPDARRAFLFDRLNDPYERRNLAPRRLDLLATMNEQLKQHTKENEQFRKSIAGGQIKLDEETRERLRALGYLDTD